MERTRALSILVALALLLGMLSLPTIAEEETELVAPPAELAQPLPGRSGEDGIEAVPAPSPEEAYIEEEIEVVPAPEGEGGVLPEEAPSPFVIEDGVLTAYTGEGTDVILPENVAVIAASAFAGNAALVSVTCPDGLRAIEDYAFAGCAALERVVYPGTAAVGEMAFAGSAMAAPAEVEAEKPESAEESGAAVSRAAAAFTTQPSDRIAYVNENVTLKIAFSGTAYLTQWQYRKSGSDSWQDAVSDGARSNSWTFKATAGMSGRRYRCRVTYNGSAFYSDAMLLTVVERPKINRHPVDAHVAVGDTVTLGIEASGYGLTYLWQKHTEGSNGWFNTVSLPKAPNATFTASKKLDGNMYRCAVTDGAGSTVYSNPMTLTVSDGPVITAQPFDEIIVTDGRKVTLAVVAGGVSLSYQWQYRKPGAATWTDASSAEAKAASWKFEAKYAWSGRRYRCVVTDGSGDSVISNPTTLTVNPAPPVITRQPQDVSIAAGEKGTISIAATGTGLTYQWQYTDPGQTGWTKVNGVTGSSWTTTGDPGKNGCQYRCVITNVEGKVVKSNRMTLTVLSGPGITAQPADRTVMDGNSVTLAVRADGSSLSYQWQYQNPGASAWTNAASAGAKAASWTFAAKYAWSGRRYRCVVTNGGGASSVSDFMTLTVIPAPTVITRQPQDVIVAAGQKATISITATGTGLTYQWQYMDPGQAGWTNVNGVTGASWTTTGDPGKNGRQYRCVITNAAGEVKKSNRMTLTVKNADGSVAINAAYFPDERFRDCVYQQCDTDGNWVLSAAEISEAAEIMCRSSFISDLTGIKYLTSLKRLYCENNSLTRLDLSGCSALETLGCSANGMTSLNLSGCSALKDLGCQQNDLTGLNLSDCPALLVLNCCTNNLTSLNLSGCPELKELSCSDNHLTSLNLSGCPALERLYCSDNPLTGLDLRYCPQILYQLYIYGENYDDYDFLQLPDDVHLTGITLPFNTLTIPQGQVSVVSKAYMGVPANVIEIQSGCESIGSKAFADNTDLLLVDLRAFNSSIAIAGDAFSGCGDHYYLLIDSDNTELGEWAEINGYKYIYIHRKSPRDFPDSKGRPSPVPGFEDNWANPCRH